MKIQGFTHKNLPLSQALKQGIILPDSLSLWGSFSNFDVLRDENFIPTVFLLYYYDEIVAGLLYLEQSFCKIFKVGFSPHPNQSIPYAHLYVKPQDSQRADEQLLTEFVTRLSALVKREFLSFTIVFPPEFEDMREFKWSRWTIEPRYTYYVPLNEVKQQGLASFVGKKIRNIIKNTKATLQIRPISASEFFDCYHQTYKRQHKKTPKSLTFFKQLSSLSNMHFYGAFEENILTSGIVICEAGDTSYFVSSGALDNHYSSNGVTYLLYDYIENILTNSEKGNIISFDLVGANSKRLALFKTNFQPRLSVYFSVTKKSFLGTILKKSFRL